MCSARCLLAIRVVLVASFSTALAPNLFAQEPAGKQRSDRIVPQNAAPSSDALAQMAATLANRNKPPTLHGDGPSRLPLFDHRYDWQEQDRILKSLDLLTRHADRAWPFLVKQLGNEDYCLTVRRLQSVANNSVDVMCSVILRESLVAAYVPCLPPTNSHPAIVRRLRSPDIIPETQFKEWFELQVQQGESLVDLQIEMCQWAVKQLNELDDVPVDARRISIRKIEKQIESLQTTQQASMPPSVFGEFRRVFNKDSADSALNVINQRTPKGDGGRFGTPRTKRPPSPF